jgi:hypothetical protein
MKINPPSHLRRALRAIPLLTICSIFALSGAAHAAVSVLGTVNLAGGVYTYSYSVTNSGSPDDLTFIDIPVGASFLITNLTAPTGFGIFTDLNLVTFYEDADPATPQTFAPNSTVQFFTYDSTAAPFAVTYTANDSQGNTFTGQTIAAVPEPSGLLLIAASALPMLAVRRRRNR